MQIRFKSSTPQKQVKRIRNWVWGSKKYKWKLGMERQQTLRQVFYKYALTTDTFESC